MDQFRASRQSELRGGVAPWAAGLTRPIRQPLDRNLAVDVLIVGGGITGSMMAEHLARQDRKVCIIDRERPGFGSTAASTAMLEWEIDRSLTELSAFYGFERAADVYQLSHSAVAGLYRLAHSLRLPSALRPRDTVYLAAGDHGAKELLEEHELRKRAGLPGAFLGYRELRSEYGFDREAAIVSPGSAEVDPLLLSHGLLSAAAERGASLFDAEATAYDSFGRGVHVATDNGCCIEAAHVVLATGYILPEIVTSDLHKTASSWVVATLPQPPEQLWRDRALIWEASSDYLYARTTAEDRIIIGGEDDDQVTDPDARDALMPEKAKILLDKLHRLWPQAAPIPEYVWSGAFSTTVDGLPLIGPVPGQPRIYAAYGYGGNGITFSYLASRLIGRLIDGERLPALDHFALDRSPV
ncbi:NAD(P)/FAD-dependent oxidoreductase [Rhodopseudomonas palustris]|uniref:NAD(P)/FAD-dependent oxidoreductase n=1 Tax=Rhodopseudomonas palustris TaxID=1076 RepID=UPI000CECC96A|nr:FAD-dependent oxidoreductase [Rhodopseudomonas palustris]PPQ43888.1 FAD-dependent oxidoreductase [Rhodopseudomonas palustris]QLH70585.1 FAD-binding oxidoreductase [Rhodopseudomonas palustris]RHZ96645.1 FAD-binding oxidoreductase [Rhodopseudomonas palustris]WBU31314.1 FAD-dependent oxidoreductase [Rhodopseudomonas palustris]